MKHEAEYVKVSVLVRERLPDQVVAGEFQYAIVENGIQASEGGVANAVVAALGKSVV